MTLTRPGWQCPLVLVGAGSAAAVAALQAEAGPSLASALGLPWREPLATEQPPHSLASLADHGPGLVPLPLDPGLALQGFGHWAEALGAWRQPVLLLLAAEQMKTGLPAAMTALLAQWRVPLGGLVQAGGPWQPDLRRGDGLPWLGTLEEPGDLAAALALRWAVLVER